MGLPWALLLAFALVACVEAYLHTRPKMSLIAYASDEGQYHAVVDTVEAQGTAEVALVGSSQMREGILMPVLKAQLEKLLRRPVWVANYAVRGARADAMDAEVRFLLKRPKPPTLIVVGVSTRDVRAESPDWPRLAVYWTPNDWWQNFRRHGAAVLGVLPQVIRNAAGQVLDTLKYREEIGLALQRPFARFGVDATEEGNPILGQVTRQNEGVRGLRSLSHTTVPVRRMLERAQENYAFDRPAKPSPAMRQALRDLAGEFAARPAGGLFVQMPVADALADVLTRNGQAKAFNAAVVADTKAAGVDYLPVAVQGFHPTDDHFIDLQHLNHAGAEAYSVWLAGEIARRQPPNGSQ